MADDTAARFNHVLRVRWAECDPQGVAFNGVYLTWCDIAVTEYWRAVGLPYRELVERGMDFMLVATELRYRAPALPDEDIVVGARVVRFGRSSMGMNFEVHRAGVLLFTASATYVFVGTDRRPAEVASWVRHAVAAYEGDDSLSGPPPRGD